MTTQTEALKRYLDDCDKHAIVPDIAGAFHFAWQEALAQPEQEPVGWVDDGGKVFWKDKLPADGEDIYTTPPQRKPLTIDQIASIAIDRSRTDGIIPFVRAIEAAHNIKE